MNKGVAAEESLGGSVILRDSEDWAYSGGQFSTRLKDLASNQFSSFTLQSVPDEHI